MKGLFALFLFAFLVVVLAMADSVPDDGVMPIAPVGECPAKDGKYPVLLPDSERKDIFYICSHGYPMLTYCNPGLVFDPQLNVCVFPN